MKFRLTNKPDRTLQRKFKLYSFVTTISDNVERILVIADSKESANPYEAIDMREFKDPDTKFTFTRKVLRADELIRLFAPKLVGKNRLFVALWVRDRWVSSEI